MQLRVSKLLHDVLEAATALQRYVEGRNYEEYLRERMLRSAIEREFEILGEALRQLSSEDGEVYAAIPSARRFVAFRNVLAHRYAEIDPRIAWGTIQASIPDLVRVVRQRLAEPEA